MVTAKVALSVSGPWWWFLLRCPPGTTVPYKPVENREWRTSYRGRVAIHVPQSFQQGAWDDIPRLLLQTAPRYWSKEAVGMILGAAHADVEATPRGCLAGELDITACVTSHPSPWFSGPFGFLVTDPVVYPEPVLNVRGQRGLFPIVVPQKGAQ